METKQQQNMSKSTSVDHFLLLLVHSSILRITSAGCLWMKFPGTNIQIIDYFLKNLFFLFVLCFSCLTNMHFFNCCQFGRGLRITIMCQFGTGLQIAITLIHQQISVLFISGIQPPNPANALRSDTNAMPASTRRAKDWDCQEKMKKKDWPTCENNLSWEFWQLCNTLTCNLIV